MPTRFNRPHIDIAVFRDTQPYTASASNVSGSPRERAEHGRRLKAELDASLALGDTLRPDDAGLPPATGAYVEVTLSRGASPDALDMKTQGVRSGATRAEANNDRSVLLFVPDEARPALKNIISDYLTEDTEKGYPRNRKKVEAIEAFRAARLERFWTDDPAALPQDAQRVSWWGLWCFKDRVDDVEQACVALRLHMAHKDRWMTFPEIVVIPVYARRPEIEILLFATGAIAELRRASDSPAFFTDDVRGEQHPWVEDLAERIEWPGSDAPAVCIIDTGVNRGHALIEPGLDPDDMHAVNDAWGTDDHDAAGHGTSMAGLALHGDLTAALADQGERTLGHRLESVKILPPDGFEPNQLKSYGPFTQSAISLPEIAAPERSRVYCMAVTNDNVTGAIPSVWSAAIDQAADGAMIGDEPDGPKRLIILSGGNVPAEVEVALMLPQDRYPVEDPAQAWNALTVGGYTDFDQVLEAGYKDWTAVAEVGDLSPHSRTSIDWPATTPFKPEVVMEAGNRATSPAGTETLTFDSLSVLSTGKDMTDPLVAFQATSAACAQAARLAARLAADHPDYWPETIRALIIHSAVWTPPMAAAFAARSGKRERAELIRRFGYGVPIYESATASAADHLALFAQAEIQPFRLKGDRKFNECHYYQLPIPRSLLEDLENEEVELKVTLSYFIEPNPGLGANVDPQRYRSHGLRFDLKRSRELIDDFKKRVNAAESPDERRRQSESDDVRWMFGGRSVSAGSLHCDIWKGPAIELIGRDMVCVKPVNGWSRGRSTREQCNKARRYALIVSLKAADITIDLYTPIQIFIETPVSVETQI